MIEFIRLAPLDHNSRVLALSWLDTRVELVMDELNDLRPDARKNLYRSAVRIAALDRHIADGERAFLQVLQERLDIDDATVQEIHRGEFPAQDD